MVKKLLSHLFALLILVSCSPKDLESLDTPIVRTATMVAKTPVVISTKTAIPAVERSPTPFPEEKSLKGITEDGKWEISGLLGYDAKVQVRSVDGKSVWVLDETTLPDVRFGQLWNYKTSNDNNSLFFGLDPRQSETVILNRWPPNYGLYELNLADGAIETILKPHIDSSGYVSNGYFALSPDESQIIYCWWDEPAIVLRKLTTLEEQIFSLPHDYKVAGPFVWSPNGMSVIFTMWSNVWDYPTEFQIARLDIEDNSVHLLYVDNEENMFFVPVEWTNENIVYLKDRRSGKQWQIEPFTGQLQERIPTSP